MYRGVPYSPQTLLKSAISATATVIYVEDANDTIFPAAPNTAVLERGGNYETIEYEGKTEDSLVNVTRAVAVGDKARDWPAGTSIRRNFTAADLHALQDNIKSIHDYTKSKLDLVADGTKGNFIAIDKDGNSIDSGKNSESFAANTITLKEEDASKALPGTLPATPAALLQVTRNCLHWLTERFNSYGHANRAVTADALTTPVEINGIPFDGSEDIQIPVGGMSNMGGNALLGRNVTQEGAPLELTAAQVRAFLNVANGATANPTTVTQAAAETGTATAVTSWTAQRVFQAQRRASGVFSPRIVGTTTAGNTTYSVQQGRFTRVGDMVNVSGVLVVNNRGTINGNVLLTGLPLNMVADSCALTLSYLGLNATNVIPISRAWNVSATQLLCIVMTSAGEELNLEHTHITTGTRLIFWGTYHVA